MPFRPILARPHFAALVAGILCFFPAYLLMTWLAPKIGLVGVLLFLAAQFVGTGLAVAYYARRAPLLHGIILGAPVGVLALFSKGVIEGHSFGEIFAMFEMAPVVTWGLCGIVLCTAGALVGDFIGSRRASGSLAT